MQWEKVAYCFECNTVAGPHDTAFCMNVCPTCGDDKVPFGRLHGDWDSRIGMWISEAKLFKPWTWLRGHWIFKDGD